MLKHQPVLLAHAIDYWRRALVGTYIKLALVFSGVWLCSQIGEVGARGTFGGGIEGSLLGVGGCWASLAAFGDNRFDLASLLVRAPTGGLGDDVGEKFEVVVAGYGVG